MVKPFDTMVKPVLLYGSEIWGFQISEAVENNQDQFCKRFFYYRMWYSLEEIVEDIQNILTIIVDALSTG